MGLISNGTTIFDNGAMASGFGGSMTFISSATASSSASIEFTLGDYKEYKFFFVNMHPATDNAHLKFQCSIDNGSNYNVTITSTYFFSYHYESDSGADLIYDTSADLAQSTSFQSISENIGNNNDQNAGGYLHLFNPSSNTYVKHFISTFQTSAGLDYSRNDFSAGYFNDTNDLTNIKFQMSSGNIDDGKILMFGLN